MLLHTQHVLPDGSRGRGVCSMRLPPDAPSSFVQFMGALNQAAGAEAAAEVDVREPALYRLAVCIARADASPAAQGMAIFTSTFSA
jgi:hypothetical protein